MTSHSEQVVTPDSPSKTRVVSASIDVTVLRPTVLEFQISAARVSGLELEETAEFTVNDAPISPTELVGTNSTRIHRFSVTAGSVRARYRARISGTANPAGAIDELDRTIYLRPSRYAESDRLYSFAAQQFPAGTPAELADQVTSYVRNRLTYVPGSSDPTDGAIDTLLAGVGVCRDYAHLVVALLRAVKVPARLTSVYAPGLSPMDFHAVAEALIDDTWYVLDATGLAPRQSLVRIGTGRDATDTAFLDNHGGAIRLIDVEVTATVSGRLPTDTLSCLATLPY